MAEVKKETPKAQASKSTKTPVESTKATVKPIPKLGGSYQRDPSTGELTLIQRSEPRPPRANSIKKEGE